MPLWDDERSFAEIRKVLQDVLRILALHPWAFFVPFCLATSAAFVVSLYSPRTYSASTTFERRDDPVALSLDISTGAASFKFFRKTMVEDLTSVRYMDEVVDNLGLTKDFERDAEGNLTPESIKRRNGLARSLASRLSISSRSPGEFVDQVTIRYQGSDPHIGSRLVEEVKNTYIRRSREWIRNHLVGQRDYFQQQVSAANRELVDARRASTKFRIEHPLLDPSDPGSVNVRLAQLENERKRLLLRQKEHEADLLAQKQLLMALDPKLIAPVESDSEEPVGRAPVSAESLHLAEEIRKTEQAIVELRATRGMTWQHPQVADLVAKKEQLTTQLAEQRKWDREHLEPDTVGGMLSGSGVLRQVATLPVQIDRAIAAGKVATIESKLADISEQLAVNKQTSERLLAAKQNIFENQEELAQVRDRVNRARAEATKLQNTLAKINPAIEATDHDRLVNFTSGPRAQASVLPIAPKANNIVFLSLVIGVAAGVLFVILAEILDHVYRSASQVASSLGVPILDNIDEIVTTQDRRRLLVQRMVVAPMVLGGGLVLTTLSGAMAYLSLGQPAAYAKLRRIPQAAIELFAGDIGQSPRPKLVPFLMEAPESAEPGPVAPSPEPIELPESVNSERDLEPADEDRAANQGEPATANTEKTVASAEEILTEAEQTVANASLRLSGASTGG
ncbi:MAG: hypothetical protein ACE5E5_00390 [Phycisphaerae bacterium]